MSGVNVGAYQNVVFGFNGMMVRCRGADTLLLDWVRVLPAAVNMGSWILIAA